jgi:hypothetical protein
VGSAGALLSAAITAAPSCYSASTPPSPCSVASMAAWDFANWATALQTLLPNYTAIVSCGTVTPVSCTVNINWSENAVGVNSTEAAAAASAIAASAATATFQNPSYTLYVQP